MRKRLVVFRSNKSIYAQIIDEKGKVLAVAGEKNIKAAKATKIQKAALVGELLAKKAVLAKVKEVFFDRSIYRYHGRVKALAQAARKGGLEF